MNEAPRKLSVVIPVYNEAATVQSLVRAVLAVALPGGLEREVICVNDCSTDGTAAKLDELPGLFPGAGGQPSRQNAR